MHRTHEGVAIGTKNQTSTGTSSGTATTTLSPQVQAAYNSLLTQLGGVSSGTNAATNAATSGLGALAATPNANYGAAGATLSGATAPAYASISNYLSPYLSGALQTQIASQNQQNAQQQQQVIGNAAAQGALGGNRVGVAQGQLAGQQAIANNAANSSLINSAYQQAENAALSGQQNQIAAGSAQSNLGNAQNASTLSNLLGQLSAGSSQFANLGTLSGATSGLSNSGQTISTTGTTSQTQPAGNWISSLLGAGLGIAGLFDRGGVVPHYDAGGSIGNAAQLMSALNSTLEASRPAQNGNQANDNSASPLGNLASQAQMKAGVSNIRNWLTPHSMPLGLGETGGFGSSYNRGGLVRGYDDGGYVTPPPAFYSGLLDQIVNQPDTGPSSYGTAGNTALMPAVDASPAPQPMLPENGYTGLSDQIVAAPRSVQPQLIGNTDVTVPASYGDAVDHVASAGPSAMVNATRPKAFTLADPSMEILPPDVTPLSRAATRGQSMRAQGFPVAGLGALAQADEQAYGLPSGYLSRTAQIESGGNPTASNPSGASGLFQFMPATARQYGLGNPNNPVAATNAAARLAADNASVMTKALGRDPTAGELYLAHQQGAGGALALLRNPSAPAASIIGAGAVIQNGGTPDMTAGQFATMWENRFGAGDNGARGVVPNAVTPTGAPAGGIPGGLGITPPGGYGVPDSNAGYATNIEGVLQSLKAGKGLNLSPDARMGLLSAAAGMMSGTSPFALTNVGTGVQQGLKTWQDQQAVERQNALANSAIGAEQGALGLSGEQLQLAAAKNKADIAQEIAQAGATNVEAARNRFVQTPIGMLEYDPTNPDAPPKVIPYGQMMGGSSVSTPGAAAPEPKPDADGFVTTAPAAPGVSPLLMNPTTAPLVVQQTQTALAGAQGDAINAQALNAQLQELGDLSKSLPASGFLAQGAGFNQRVEAVRGINSALQSMGIAPLDPQDVGTAEGMKKLATQLQFAVADAVKNDPAAATIAQAASASPSGENTAQGFSRIVGNIEALNKRSVDRYQFLQSWANSHYGDLTGADVAFNQLNPPKAYVAYGQKIAKDFSARPVGQQGTQANPITPTSQADIDNAAPGTVFSVDGKLMVKR